MPVQVGNLLKELLVAAGIPETDKLVTDVLTIAATVPDEAAGKIKTHLDSLMTVDQAKNNSVLNKHFLAKALNPVDKTITDLYDELGIDDPTKEEINKLTSTYDKVTLALKKVQELTAKKAGAHTSADKKTLADEIDKLNKQIVAERQKLTDEVNKANTAADAKIMNYAIDAQLRTQSYANADVPVSVNSLTAKALLDQELAAKGAKIVRNPDDTLKLVQSANPDLDYTENNKSLSFGDFVTRTLTNSKMLKVTGQAPVKPSKTPQKTDGDPVDNSKVIQVLDDQISQLEAALK